VKFPEKEFDELIQRESKSRHDFDFDEPLITGHDGAVWGWNKHKALMLAKIKEKKDLVCLAKEIEDTPMREGKLKVLKWLEGELK